MNAPRTFSLLGCPCIAFRDEAEVKNALHGIVAGPAGGYSVAINAEKIQRFNHDQSLREVIANAALPVADGAGAVLGLRLIYGAPCRKIDLPRILLEKSNEAKWRLFVGGASEEVNASAADAIARRYPDINIVGRVNGYAHESEMLEKVLAARPNVMLLAMGSPRQELAAARLIEQVPGIFIVGCGGALDILAGKTRRAPRFMIENNLEWMYRLYKEPSRWRRQLILPRYMMRVMREALGVRFAALLTRT